MESSDLFDGESPQPVRYRSGDRVPGEQPGVVFVHPVGDGGIVEVVLVDDVGTVPDPRSDNGRGGTVNVDESPRTIEEMSGVGGGTQIRVFDWYHLGGCVGVVPGFPI